MLKTYNLAECIALVFTLCWVTASVIVGATFLVRRIRNMTNYKTDDFDEPEYFSIGARVINKRADILQTGSYYTPSHKIEFWVTFLRDDGITKEFSVSEEMYNGCQLYQIGTLVTINDDFFDFGDGEEIDV